jgi:hypothetical protein
MAPILRDLAATGAPLPEVVDGSWSESDLQPSAWLRIADGDRIAVSVWLPESPEQRIASLADRVQEGIVELLWPSGSTWPECPEHPDAHPLAAAVFMNQPWWTCPKSGARIALIGELA